MKDFQKRFYPDEINPRVYAQDYGLVTVLGAVMKWDPKVKDWTFPDTVEQYSGLLVMGQYRAWAAAEFYDHAQVLLVTGGSDKHPVTGEKCSRSAELTRRIREYGVPESKLVDIGKIGASHTQGNVENTIAFLTAHPELLRERRMGIISPTFQAKRAEMMYRDNAWFRQNGVELSMLLVEDILTAAHPELENCFREIYDSFAGNACLWMETQGIEDFIAKKYAPQNPVTTR